MADISFFSSYDTRSHRNLEGRAAGSCRSGDTDRYLGGQAAATEPARKARSRRTGSEQEE
ncbi:protein of unassigned function [Methylobacterium oryzae CBMB20]|uniref:Protein of unassigned function n=1 Tax=Methylobacterium oryzae CBMB20 TaxID=693986 RepID=A0A089NV78_9HYPH|nr:protein of unassigned function [Methylobacterium oryzae CBMB20]